MLSSAEGRLIFQPQVCAGRLGQGPPLHQMPPAGRKEEPPGLAWHRVQGDPAPAGLAFFRPSEPPAIGTTGMVMHPTHKPLFSREAEAWFCNVCGAYAMFEAKGLAKPCSGRLSRGGKHNLARIQKGLAPGNSRSALEFNLKHADRGFHGRA